MRDSRLASDVLHDVDLAALRPSDRIDVCAEHPEGGPESLPAWDADPCLEATVCLREQTLGLEPRRRVATSSVPALVRRRRRLGARRDHEVAIAVQRNVFGARRVELPLLVAEAISAGICDPLRAVERRARRSVELVTPDRTRQWREIGTGGEREESEASRFHIGSRVQLECPDYGPERPTGTPPGARTTAMVTPSITRVGGTISSAPSRMASSKAARRSATWTVNVLPGASDGWSRESRRRPCRSTQKVGTRCRPALRGSA